MNVIWFSFPDLLLHENNKLECLMFYRYINIRIKLVVVAFGPCCQIDTQFPRFCANVFANPSKSLDYEIYISAFDAMLFHFCTSHFNSLRILYSFHCYGYILCVCVDSRLLYPGHVDSCNVAYSFVRLFTRWPDGWLAGWLSLAYKLLIETVFAFVFVVDVIELYLQHKPP